MTESDQQKVLAALSLLRETCSANITPLGQSPSQKDAPQDIPLPTLRKDYLSLCTLIYTSTTKISLVLKPSDPTYSASLRPIQDLTTHISSVTTCATLFDGHGNTLAREVRRLAKELCEAVKALAQSLLDVLDNVPSSSTNTSEEDYLIRTGAVHELVEKIRRDIPDDNFTAVKKKFMLDKEMIEDSVNEVNSMLEGDQDDDPFGEDGDDDGGWDELGFGSSKKLSEVEIARVQKIQPLIRILSLLHKRILPDLIKPLDENAIEDVAKLDIFPSISNSLLLCLEELVAVLYAPQDPSSISSAISSLQDTVRSTQSTLTTEGAISQVASNIKTLQSSMGEMRLGNQSGTPKKDKDPVKWFDTCFAQIYKLSKSISDALDSEAMKT